MPIISTNDVQTHREVKVRAAKLELTLGKLFDKYAKIGLLLDLEKIDPEDQAKIAEIKRKLYGEN